MLASNQTDKHICAISHFTSSLIFSLVFCASQPSQANLFLRLPLSFSRLSLASSMLPPIPSPVPVSPLLMLQSFFSSSLLSCLRIWEQIHLGISPDWTSRSSISSKPAYLYEGSRSKVAAFINASQSREIVLTQNDSHARDCKELLPSETTFSQLTIKRFEGVQLAFVTTHNQEI